LNFKISKKQAYWILQITGWSFYVVIWLVFLFIADEESWIKAVNIFLFALYFFFSTHLLRGIIIQKGWLTISLIRLIPRVLLTTFILAASHYVFSIIIGYMLGIIDYQSDFKPVYIVAYVFSMMVFYLLWALIYFIYHYFEKYNSTLKYEAAIYEFELNKLKSQLNPHFIFNALNSIRALVDEDPVKSKKAITQLSNILRNSLIMNKRKLIDFRDEIYTVRDYLDLEAIRLEERLKVDLDIDPATETFQVPPLMLQTLVENGIKHGVATLPKGGMISVKAWADHSSLFIQIRNSGQYVNGSEVNPAGYGLENTRQRLNLIFGRSATFNIRNENKETVLTEISIPQYI
jgi:two-component system LytT family sensor kinase